MLQIKHVILAISVGLSLTSCPSPIPIEIRPAVNVAIPTDKVDQCVTLKAFLKSGAQSKFEALKQITEAKTYTFTYGNFTPVILQDTDLDGIDQLEVSCTGTNKGVVKASKPFSGPSASFSPSFEFSELKP
jgi:hypothetical protein